MTTSFSKFLVVSVFVVGSSFLAGCSVSAGGTKLIGGDANAEHTDATQSYQYIENGCDTEKHTFNAGSQADATNQVCAALKDESLNHGCAVSERQMDFKQRCPGQSWN